MTSLSIPAITSASMAEWKAVLSLENAWRRYDDERRHFADALLRLRGHLHCEPALLGGQASRVMSLYFGADLV